MNEPNAMIVWVVADKLHFCEATVISTDTPGLAPVGIVPQVPQYDSGVDVKTGSLAEIAARGKMEQLVEQGDQ